MFLQRENLKKVLNLDAVVYFDIVCALDTNGGSSWAILHFSQSEFVTVDH